MSRLVTASTLHVDASSAFDRTGDDQPRLWSIDRWVQLRHGHFGEECFFVDSGSDLAFYEHFHFPYHRVQLQKDSLSWDFFDTKWQKGAVNIFRFPRNLLCPGWGLPWSMAWLRGLCQALIVAKFLKAEYLLYNELDLALKWPSSRIAEMFPETNCVACPMCRYGIETGLMMFRMNAFDESLIERLAIPGQDKPESHIHALLNPDILPLTGDRDEGNPPLGEGVDVDSVDWLMHSSADKMERFYERALKG